MKGIKKVEKALEFKELIDNFRMWLHKNKVVCKWDKTPLWEGEIKAYEHPFDGVRWKGRKIWLYVECPKCGHQWSWKKLGYRGTIREEILNLLKEAPSTASELAEKLQSPYSYILQNLYRLEDKGLIYRKEWLGAWVWAVKEGRKK